MEEKRIFPEAIQKYDLALQPLLSDPVCIAVTDTHELFGKQSCPLDALMNYPYITNKNPREDAFYTYLGESGHTRDVIQVNHVMNYDIAGSTNGFWAGAKSGLLSMQETMKKPIGILTIDSCRFYYDIALIHKKAPLSPPTQKFAEALIAEADAMNVAAL